MHEFQGTRLSSLSIYDCATLFYFQGGFYGVRKTKHFSLYCYISIAMFGIGYELGGYYSGACVMSLACCSPHILANSHQFFIDFPQTALSALAFYFLLKSDGFKERRASLWMGISLAFAFLAKWSTLFFMIVPILWFVILVIFESRQSVTAFIIGSISLIFTLLGISWYYLNLESLDLDSQWLKYFFYFIIIPNIVGIVALRFLEWRGKKSCEEKLTQISRIQNFFYSFAIFQVIALPWYFWAGKAIKLKFIDDIRLHQRMGDITAFLVDFFKTSFSFFPFFLLCALVGVIFIFLYRKEDLYRRLVLPVSLILAIIIMTKIGFQGIRYLLSFIIFTSALGGFWVYRLGKFRSAVAVLFIASSVFTILSWTLPPVENPIIHVIYYPTTLKAESNGIRIFLPEKPDERVFRTSEIVSEILWSGVRKRQTNEEGKDPNVLIFNACDSTNPRNFIEMNEFLNWEVFFQKGMRANFFEVGFIPNDFDPQSLPELGNYDLIMIVHENFQDPGAIIDKVMTRYNKFSRTSWTIQFDDEHKLTYVRLVRDSTESGK